MPDTPRPTYSTTLERQFAEAKAEAARKATQKGRVYWVWLTGAGRFHVSQEKPAGGAWSYTRDFIHCTDAAVYQKAVEARRRK